MRDLVRNCLRMRPERIIVGEVRGPEAFDLLQAMNTGHDGSMGTLHANSPREAMSRLESMITMGGFSLPLRTIREMIVGSIDVILQAGESVRNIVGGDRAPQVEGQTARWEVKEGTEGTGEKIRQHVFLTAVTPGMSMGVIVTTTHRTYYLTCKSVKTSPVRVVRWRYQPDPEGSKPKPTEPGLLPEPETPRHYHVGYELTGATPPPVWQPRQVVDDGKRLSS